MAKSGTNRRARLRARAERGDVEACFDLALDLSERPPLREREAVTWLRAAADLGHARAQVNLGMFYAYGIGVRRNRGLANRLYRAAAAGGNAVAMHNLGIVWRDGLGVPSSPSRSLAWFRSAANLGEADSVRVMLERARREKLQDRRRWLALLRRNAQEGDAQSQVSLGVNLWEGRNARRNRAEAERWYRRAARQGDEHAWHNLGQIHRKRGDWPRALRCYREAAARGHGGALHWLLEYDSGRCGAPRQPRRLAARLRSAEAAARKGESRFYAVLADHYGEHGNDPRRAVRWLRAGADENDPECLMTLGTHLFDGEGVRKNRARAARLYRRAAELDDARAAYLLGLCHRDGEGVRRDPRAARTWFERAARGGETDARRALTRLRRSRSRPPSARARAAGSRARVRGAT